MGPTARPITRLVAVLTLSRKRRAAPSLLATPRGAGTGVDRHLGGAQKKSTAFSALPAAGAAPVA